MDPLARDDDTVLYGRHANMEMAKFVAYERVMEALRYVEETVRSGVSCLTIYREVHAMLDGYRGCGVDVRSYYLPLALMSDL